MTINLRKLLRPLVPNVPVRIRHVEQTKRLEIRFREHLGLFARGAGAFEQQYVRVMKKLIREGDTVFDVGANIGFYSVLFSCWVGPSGRVAAYEPDPANVELLRRNLAINDCQNVLVRPLAVGRTCGTDVFSVDDITRSTGHLGAGATYGEVNLGNGHERLMNVAITTLDQEIQEVGVPAFVKMDIEGGEFDALSGAIDILGRHRPLIVSELNGWTAANPTGTEIAKEALHLLTRFDYSLWDLDSAVRAEPDSPPWMVLAAPQEKEDEIRGSLA
jgi:FkbM family methyltransferase